MGYSDIYGTVDFERGDIDESEPIFIFRATDKLAARALEFYAHLCERQGSSNYYVNAIDEARELFLEWQELHTAVLPGTRETPESEKDENTNQATLA